MTRKEKIKLFRDFHRKGRKLLCLNDVPIKIKFTEEVNFGATTSQDNTRSRFTHNFNLEDHHDETEIRDTVIHELLEVYTWPLMSTFFAICEDDTHRTLMINEKEHVIGRLSLVLREML